MSRLPNGSPLPWSWPSIPVIVAAVLLLTFVSIGRGLFAIEENSRVGPIQEALSAIPSRLIAEEGTWVRQREVAVPSRQAEIFGLSASMSAEYLRLRSRPQLRAVVFVAYCSDARTMAGHHPPRCYPASGWLMSDQKAEDDFSFERSDGRRILGTIYRFVREGVITAELTVVNGFFASGERFFGSLVEARKVVKPALLGGKGLFQFQILFQGTMSNDDILGYATEIMNAIPEAIFDELMLVPAGSVEVQAVEPGGNA